MRVPVVRFLSSLAMVVAAATPLSGAQSKPDSREPKAREFMSQRVVRESGGALTLTRFAKTNGYDQVLQGTKMYVLEWSADVVTQREIWKPGNAIAGHWENFGVFQQQPGQWDTLLTGGASRYRYGTTFRLTGKTLFRLTDLGWRPEELAVVTSEVLPDVPKTNSKSPFVGTWRLAQVCDDCIKTDEAFRITEMSSGLFRLERGFFDQAGRATFDKFPRESLFLRLAQARLVGVSNETGVENPVRLEIGADGQLTFSLGPLLPSKGPRVP